MSEGLGLDAAAGAIYEASIDDRRWPGALSLLGQALSGAGVYLGSWASRRPAGAPLFSATSDSLSPEAVAGYNEHYAALDPRLAVTLRLEAGQIWACHDSFDTAFVRSSEFYNDFLLRHGYRYTLAACLLDKDGETVGVGIQRTPRQGCFERRDQALLRAALPHLARAVRVHRELRVSREAAARRQTMLDHFAAAALLVDADARVLERNAAAERLVVAGDGLLVRGGRLVASRPEATARLLHLIKDAASVASRRGGGGGACHLPHADGVYAALVIPTAAGTACGRGPPAALVLVTDPAHRWRPPEECLRSLHGLTSAEARVAAALCDGDSLVEVARRLAIAHETARQHLKRIVEKTGCRRQSDLVRILLTGPAALPRSGSSP